MIDEELKQLVKENKEILTSLDKRIKKIEKRFTLNTIFGFVKFLFIVAPIIFGVVYLMPIFKDYVKIFEPAYKTFVSQFTFMPSNDNENVNSNINQNEVFLQSFCDAESRELMVEKFCK